MMIEEKEAKRRRDLVDRISELPEFILHNILSIVDTKGACRASVLSKRWYAAWSSIPVLNFQFQHFKEYDHVSFKYDDYDFYDFRRYIGFISKTMQRYSRHNYRITKLHLELPEVDDKLKLVVDKWIRTAVQNQVQELDIKILPYNTQDYMLPEILFSAKSLKVLKCDKVGLPYSETMELISLEFLTICLGIIDVDMLQRIVCFCPLVELNFMSYGLTKTSLEEKTSSECFGCGTSQPNLKTSPLTKFVYSEFGGNIRWPWNVTVRSLKNLRKLEICGATIKDDIVCELVRGLVALESLELTACSMPKCIKISSISLKEIRLRRYSGWMITIDAPNLLEFWYDFVEEEEKEFSVSLIRAHDHCNSHYDPVLENITVVWFVKLKKFLMKTGFFKSLVLDLSHPTEVVEEVDQLRDVAIDPPYKLRELKLLNTDEWKFRESSLVAFLDGLLWSCHPDVISMTVSWTAKLILDILKRKAQCRKHPLKSIAVEEVDYSRLLSESSEDSELEFRFRLSWVSI